MYFYTHGRDATSIPLSHTLGSASHARDFNKAICYQTNGKWKIARHLDVDPQLSEVQGLIDQYKAKRIFDGDGHIAGFFSERNFADITGADGLRLLVWFTPHTVQGAT